MKWLKKGGLRFLRGQRGIGLLETLVAVALLGLLGTNILTALDTNAKATSQLDEDVVATNLATAYIEAIKAMDYADTYPSLESIITVPPQYSVNVAIAFTSDGDTTDGITWVDTYTDQSIQRLTVTVSREGDEHIQTICAFKTKRVGLES